MGERRSEQQAEGQGNALAHDRSTAISQTNYYFEHVPPRPADGDAVRNANRTLDGMPLDDVPRPEISLPHGSRLPPFGANAVFVGRDDDLRFLARSLKGSAGSVRSPIAGISGLGGVGKTQLAGEFVYRYGKFFEGGVYWLRFSDPDNVTAEIVACGSSGSAELGSDFPMLLFDDKVKRVTATWQNELPRLLVFDGCRDINLLASWARGSGGCRVLVTSRAAFEDAAMGLKFVELDVLSREESIELLRGHLDDILADDTVLDGIAAVLGDLPLALNLAARFLVRFRASENPSEYLDELRDADPPELSYHESLEPDDGASPTRYMTSVARTFLLDLRRLDATDPIDGLALKVLARVARLAPDRPIPRELLVASLGLPDGDRGARRQVERAILKVADLGLIQGDQDVQMHALVRGVVLESVEDLQAQEDAENAVLSRVQSLAEKSELLPLLPIIPHLRALANGVGQRTDTRAGLLHLILGGVLAKMQQGHEEALSYTERALTILETSPDSQGQENYLRALLNKGSDLKALGYLDEAIEITQRTLKLTKKTFGRRHPETAYVHNNMGSALRDKAFELRSKRHLNQARSHYVKALRIREKQRPQHPPDVAESLLNLGHLMLDVQLWKPGRGYLERAVRLGGTPPVPPDLRARALELLGSLDRDQGRLSEARSHLSESADMYEAAYGPNNRQAERVRAFSAQLPPP